MPDGVLANRGHLVALVRLDISASASSPTLLVVVSMYRHTCSSAEKLRPAEVPPKTSTPGSFGSSAKMGLFWARFEGGGVGPATCTRMELPRSRPP